MLPAATKVRVGDGVQEGVNRVKPRSSPPSPPLMTFPSSSPPSPSLAEENAAIRFRFSATIASLCKEQTPPPPWRRCGCAAARQRERRGGGGPENDSLLLFLSHSLAPAPPPPRLEEVQQVAMAFVLVERAACVRTRKPEVFGLPQVVLRGNQDCQQVVLLLMV